MISEFMIVSLKNMLTGLLAALLLAGCGATGDLRDSPRADVPRELRERTEQELPQTDPDVIYYVGAAEISGFRKNFDLSAELYAKAAALSADPDIAQQAVKVAAYADQQELVLEGVDRWLALQPTSLEPHRFAAIIHLRRGDAEMAWEHLSAILGGTRQVEPWTAVVKMIAGASDRALARQLFERIGNELDLPEDESLYQQLSDLGVQLGQLEAAERYATRAIEINSENAETFTWRGRIRTSLGNAEGARADFQRAIELAPDDKSLRQSFAALLADEEDYAGALEQLGKVDDSLLVLFSKGVYAQQGGFEEQALAFYEALQELPTEDEDEKFFMLGQLAETLERPTEETVGWYEQVRSGERLDAARLRSAVVLGQGGQMDQARVILRKLQNGNAQTASNAFLAEAGLLRDQGRDEEALETYGRGLIFLPDSTDLLFARALLAEELDDLELAERDLRKVLELHPDDPNALNALGYTLADRTDRFHEALELIERALEQMPEEPAFVDSMGWVQFKLGNHEEALAYLRKALELQYDSEIAAHLGEVLWVTGEREEARRVWSEALDREPEAAVVLETLQRLDGD